MYKIKLNLEVGNSVTRIPRWRGRRKRRWGRWTRWRGRREREGGDQDHSVIVRPEDLGENLGKIDINRESKNTGGNRSRVKKYSDKRWGGGVSGNMDRDKMSLSADAPRNPVMAQLYDVWRGGVLPSLIRLHKIKQPSLSWIPLDRWRGGCCCQVNYSKINCWVFKA